jgi:hypothetical protein
LATQLSALTSASSLTPAQLSDLNRCRTDPSHFFRQLSIYDATAGEWIKFALWPAQVQTLGLIHDNQLTVILKARQLGLSWLVLGYALWLMLFRPAATVLVFSKRQEESAYLLGDERLRGMYSRLPDHIRSAAPEGIPDATMTWALANGSIARAFPTTAGDSYTATLAIVDEADLCPDLNRLMRSVKPTIDAGGKMILLSRSDKSQPESEFKRIYRGAKTGQTAWKHAFIPWHARPDRDTAWYEAQRRDILARTGSLDDLAEQYPKDDVEALAPRSLDKRIRPEWLQQCFVELPPIEVDGAPAIPVLAIYAAPVPYRKYVIGADPAEGNPTSDDSALTVLDVESGKEVAAMAGRFEPGVFAAHAYAIARFFNHAAILVERNNHGHAVLLWLRDNGEGVRLLNGHDGNTGWLTSTLGKTSMYDNCADACKNAEVKIHSFTTFMQLSTISGSTLRAPDGQFDDRATGFALAVCGRLAERSRMCDYALPLTFTDRFGRRL